MGQELQVASIRTISAWESGVGMPVKGNPKIHRKELALRVGIKMTTAIARRATTIIMTRSLLSSLSLF